MDRENSEEPRGEPRTKKAERDGLSTLNLPLTPSVSPVSCGGIGSLHAELSLGSRGRRHTAERALYVRSDKPQADNIYIEQEEGPGDALAASNGVLLVIDGRGGKRLKTLKKRDKAVKGPVP